MFFKQIIAFGTYIRTVTPVFIRSKHVNLQMQKIFYLQYGNYKIKSYCSSSKNPLENELPKYLSKKIENEDKLKLQKWLEMAKSEGALIPKKISEDEFNRLCAMLSDGEKYNYLRYLYKWEMDKAKSKSRKEKLKLLNAAKKAESDSIKSKGHIEYGLWKNTMFTFISKRTCRSLLNNRLINAMKYGQPLVIDMDFYNHMEGREVNSLAEQIQFSIIRNRVNSEPFDLTLCNVNFESEKFSVFSKKIMPNVLKPGFPMNITSKSYLDLFPKEKLIYLTPNADIEMTTYDHNAIYIIGGLVDLRGQFPLTLSKAKRENIQTVKLPLERYHKFKGSKALAVHVMVNIMLDLHYHGDFKKAFTNIPRRLIKTGDTRHLDPYDYSKKHNF